MFHHLRTTRNEKTWKCTDKDSHTVKVVLGLNDYKLCLVTNSYDVRYSIVMCLVDVIKLRIFDTILSTQGSR